MIYTYICVVANTDRWTTIFEKEVNDFYLQIENRNLLTVYFIWSKTGAPNIKNLAIPSFARKLDLFKSDWHWLLLMT